MANVAVLVGSPVNADPDHAVTGAALGEPLAIDNGERGQLGSPAHARAVRSLSDDGVHCRSLLGFS